MEKLLQIQATLEQVQVNALKESHSLSELEKHKLEFENKMKKLQYLSKKEFILSHFINEQPQSNSSLSQLEEKMNALSELNMKNKDIIWKKNLNASIFSI